MEGIETNGEFPDKDNELLENTMPEDTVQQEIDKWVEFYDEVKAYLQHGTVLLRATKNIQKAAENFTIGGDGNLYRLKPGGKDSTTVLKIPVIRNYEDRLRIVKDIHVNTGRAGIHHRRDRMLGLIGQQYYWKGQRRDICECIASCEMCSSGLGGRRRAKPPGQARDVRSPAKLQKLSTSPLTINSSIVTSNPFTPPKLLPLGPQIKSSPVSLKITTAGTSGTLQTTTQQERAIEGRTNIATLSDPLEINFSSLASTSALEVTNPVTSGTVVFLNSESTPSLSVAGFQPIFSMIDEPSASEENKENPLVLEITTAESPILQCTTSTQTPGLSAATSVMYAGSAQYTSSSIDSENSVYDLLFQLPSKPNEALFSSVIEAMHMAMKQTVDPIQLAEASEAYLLKNLGLGTGYSVVVAPSQAAAYLIAVAASMVRIDPLCVSQQIQRPHPLTVIHDACCPSGSLKNCTSLLAGVVNWNLGSLTTPMDRQMLSMAITSNRVAAVFHQPYCYPRSCQYTPLTVIGSVCHSQSTVSVIVDAGGVPIRQLSLVKFITIIKELFAQGADFVLLPETHKILGPPQTCLLIGKSGLLKHVDVSLLQSQLCLPLSCTPYDQIGTVVAYKTHQVGTLKQVATTTKL